MHCGPVTDASLRDLQNLINAARSRRDEYLAVLLQGIELYISLGREIDLLEVMRDFEREIRPAVEGTPTVQDLKRMYGERGDLLE